MNWRERIICDPQILVGKPVIKGTRLAVEFIIDLPAQNWTKTEILRNYPGLTHEDIQACLACANHTLKFVAANCAPGGCGFEQPRRFGREFQCC